VQFFLPDHKKFLAGVARMPHLLFRASRVRKSSFSYAPSRVEKNREEDIFLLFEYCETAKNGATPTFFGRLCDVIAW
jgi:hypothetical protein